MRYKKASALLIAAGLVTSLAACTSGSSPNDATNAASSAEAQQAGAGLDLIFTNQPDPVFPTSAWREQLMEVEATEALGTPTTAFFFPPGLEDLQIFCFHHSEYGDHVS